MCKRASVSELEKYPVLQMERKLKNILCLYLFIQSHGVLGCPEELLRVVSTVLVVGVRLHTLLEIQLSATNELFSVA